MILKKWEDLPESFRNEEVRKYYDVLDRKRFSLVLKRCFDFFFSAVFLIICLPLFLVLGICIKTDSKGPVFYRQERITQYGKTFRIFKFRSMVENADKTGHLVTTSNDMRVTKVGKILRRTKLDELGQLLNILKGEMTFVGVRPEVKKYVDCYTPEMMATLLLPAGITSLTSVYYKAEEEILAKADDRDLAYRAEVLPDKMYYNLKGILNFSLWNEFKVLLMTAVAVVAHKDYRPSPEELELQLRWREKVGELQAGQ